MRKAATVLVLGDPGPTRDELLLRSEIDVVWSESFRDALELLRVYRVEACIVAPSFERMEGYEPFRAQMGNIPCLVRTSVPRDAHACPTGYEPDVEPVLAFLARHTGLVFARYPRAQVSLPVEVDVQGERFQLETTNLSVSGVAIDGFPPVAPGTRAELCLDLPERPIYLLARVVRIFEVNGTYQVGLSFTDLTEGPRASIAAYVENMLPADAADERLFGELEIPMPRLRTVTAMAAETGEICSRAAAPMVASLPESPQMRRPRPSHGLTNNLVPVWFDQLSEDLSEVERTAALGGDAPEWAHRVLRLRIELARARADTMGEVPPALLDEAYRTFAGLEEETQDAPLMVRQQVSSIRASLLRDVLGEAS